MRLKIILLTILILLPNSCLALTEYQKYIINKCFTISKSFGYENSESLILCSIIGVESSFGVQKYGDNGKSIGVGQIQISTAQDMLKRSNMNILKNNLEFLLFFDDDFNISIACIYFKYLMKIFNNDIDKSCLAYNAGLGKVRKYGLKYDPNRYLNRISKMKKIVKNNLKYIR